MNDSSTNHIQNQSRALIVLIVAAFLVAGPENSTGIAQVQIRVETISKEPVTGRFARLSHSQLDLQDDSGQIQTLDLKDVLAVSATDFDDVHVP
ncbi:MAG: hypothetical protein ISQ06_16185, partial [Planctomycetaceae bacterium]|nr:hypothetical protein [Planctomycetaceae bacterium]